MAAPDPEPEKGLIDGGLPEEEEIKVVKLAPGDIPVVAVPDDEDGTDADDPFALLMEAEPDDQDAGDSIADVLDEVEAAIEVEEKPQEPKRKVTSGLLDDIFEESEEAENKLTAFADLERLTMSEVASELEAVLEELKIRHA